MSDGLSANTTRLMTEPTGEVSANFAIARGQTVITRKYHSSPLKIAKTFPLTQGQAAVYVMDSSPGMMAGDDYKLDWTLEENTKVYLTNQSYTKIHPSQERPCRQLQTIRIGPNALLEYFPEPVMPYKDSHYEGRTDVYLDRGATLFQSDILCPGRLFHGEQFQYHQYRNRMNVYYEGTLIYCSQQQIRPNEQELFKLGAFQEKAYQGNLYIFSDLITRGHLEGIRSLLTEGIVHLTIGGSSAAAAGTVLSGCSFAYKHGLICAFLGDSAWEIQAIMNPVWDLLRKELLGLPPLLIRK